MDLFFDESADNLKEEIDVLTKMPSSSSPTGVIDRNINPEYSSTFLEYLLMSEYLLLHKQFIPGVYVIPSARSPLKWFGVIFIRHGLYKEGVFRFTLFIPDNYPDCECPRLVFDPPVYNPLVNIETGELDIKRAFPNWQKNVNHLWQVVQHAKRIFYKIETESPLNSEVAELYENDPEIFKENCFESIKACNEMIYETPNTGDPHAMHFTPCDLLALEEFKKRIFTYKKKTDDQRSFQSGLSWMKPGSLQTFSKSFK